ncbi:MAG: hypothetical protein KDK29_12040 [Sedimentitalea sp.]|nr:hypothetical protein [Sedimentitalea sp.]
MAETVLARVQASPVRRWIGVAMLGLIGALVLYAAMTTPPSPLWELFLVGVGALAFFLAARMWQATGAVIELTETELRDSSGDAIAAVAEITGIERGAFAFKPSHGFLVRTRAPGPRAWRPGMWWRIGRRVGIGGVTPGAQTKAMSEILAQMLASRDRPGGPLS